MLKGSNGMDLAALKQTEDEVKATLDSWSRLKLLIAYAYIRRSTNISMDGIDYAILREHKKQEE